MAPKKALITLHEKWQGCQRCDLHQRRKDTAIVFGQGPADADILLVGEAPTKEDGTRRAALSGAIGDILDEVLLAAGIDPKTVYRTLLVACRSYMIIPATETEREQAVDREPTKDQTLACRPRLEEIIYAVDPRIVVTLGSLAFRSLVRSEDRGRDQNTIAKAQGRLFVARVPGRARMLTYPVLAVLSPQQLLANPSVAEHGPIATTTRALHRAARYVSWLRRTENQEQP
jgi:uracil-DNA glycosylase